MTTHPVGVATLHTRVESWECDHNEHWNTRFYGRSFQLASEAVAARYGDQQRQEQGPVVRHIRFHRELRVASSVEVRTSAIESDDNHLDGAVVHLLASEGTLSATALDWPGNISGLPKVTPDQVPLALPRGIDGSPVKNWSESGSMGIDVELGPVRPAQVDHSGALLFEELIRAGSIASSRQCHGFGLTPEYSENARISRMAVEMRITRHHPATAGTVLCLQSRLADVADKYFRTEHRVRTSEGELVAILEFCLLIVDIDRRRSVRVPELVLDAWRDQERGATQGRDT